MTPDSFISYSEHLTGELTRKGYDNEDITLIIEGLAEQFDTLLLTHADAAHPHLRALADLPRADEFPALQTPPAPSHQGSRALARVSLVCALGMLVALVAIEFYMAQGGPEAMSNITAFLLLLGYPTTFALGILTRDQIEGRASALISAICFSIAVGVLFLELFGTTV